MEEAGWPIFQSLEKFWIFIPYSLYNFGNTGYSTHLNKEYIFIVNPYIHIYLFFKTNSNQYLMAIFFKYSMC